MPELNVIPMQTNGIKDVPTALRKLASQIEAGEYGDAHVLAWVIDCGDSRIECGIAGKTTLPGAEGHLLFGLAQHKLERDTLGS